MPAQTLKKNLMIPDGCLVAIKLAGEAEFDLGATEGEVTATLSWDEDEFQTANAGKDDKVVSNMKIEGALNLINIDPANITKLSGGLVTEVAVAGTSTAVDDQVVAVGWNENSKTPLVFETSTGTVVRPNALPTFTTVVLNAGSPETLDDTMYQVIEDTEASSGYSIVFNPENMVTASPKTYTITLNPANVTPIASTTQYIGTSSFKIVPYSMIFRHTDTAGLKSEITMHKCSPNSGSFVWSYKPAGDTGRQAVPVQFTAVPDTLLVDGRQLMTIVTDTGTK